MSDESKNGINERILEAVLELGPRLKGVEIEVAGCVEHLKQIDNRLQLGSTQIHQHGTVIAAQEQELHALEQRLEDTAQAAERRCKAHSDELKNLKLREEDTGRHVIVQQAAAETKTALWKRAALVVGLVGGLVGIAAGLQQCANKHSSAGPRPVDMTRR